MSFASLYTPDVPAARRIDRAMRLRVARHLAGRFEGDFIDPEHPAYPEARRVWNGMIDRYPGLILRCTRTRDVSAAVDAAHTLGLPLAVRGGGHSVAGRASIDGGLVIDLGGMRRIWIDTVQARVHAEGGCLLGDVDEATARHGLVVPAGIMSETGLGGLALGGGVGWLSRKHGLTCDQFVAIELVLANGNVIEVSQDEHPELFWALRGGGGNFGVATRFTLKAHRFGPAMRIGLALYDPDDSGPALREYARLVPTLPRSVGWHAALKSALPPLPFAPPELAGQRMTMLLAMWLDDDAAPEADAGLNPLIRVGRPRFATLLTLPFADAIQKTIDREFENGHRYYTREAHLEALAPEAIDKVLAFWRDMPMEGEIEFIGLGGAVSDVAEDATAFAHRHYPLWLNVAMRWDDARHDRDYIARVRRVMDDLNPWIGKGVYTNAMNFDEQHRAVEAFGGPAKYARLARIKGTYDPGNVFRGNCNITPVPH